MDMDIIIQNVTEYVQDNVIAASVIGLLILYLLVRQPKVLLTIILFIASAYGVAWFFGKLVGKGIG